MPLLWLVDHSDVPSLLELVSVQSQCPVILKGSATSFSIMQLSGYKTVGPFEEDWEKELQYKFLAVCQNLGVKEFRVFSHVSFRSFRTPFLSNQCLHFNNGLSTGMGAQLCCNSTFVLKCRSAFDSQQSQFCSYKR
jgi:hypothetical protein